MTSNIPHEFESWSQLGGKIVMVTGASSGLGFEFCVDLAKAGCKIIAVARRIDRLNTLCDQINKMDVPIGGPHRAIAVELDVTAGEPLIVECMEKAWDAFGCIDVLINNAGVNGPKRMSLELSEKERENVVKTNLKGAWLLSKNVGARMRDGGRGGSIINISSVFGLHRAQFRGSVAYSSSKAGLDSMTKVMALELGEYNIRVNSIAPGLFRAEMTENIYRESSKVLKSVVEKTVPLASLGRVNPALTSLIRYLIHDSSSYVSGNVFIVDSGGTLPAFSIFSSL
ncbi:Rossmann-fold superfamily protein [Salvia divinorum]|uniref:(+)-borneol dehydrogenase n=1 Tax=Salvia divinorum TaxID=28513 RepID=A0ABD1I9S7_SALDI